VASTPRRGAAAGAANRALLRVRAAFVARQQPTARSGGHLRRAAADARTLTTSIMMTR
jgi:hypothetical protein